MGIHDKLCAALMKICASFYQAMLCGGSSTGERILKWQW